LPTELLRELTISVKVGDNEDAEIELTARLREGIGPRIRLRIDANEAWMVGTALGVWTLRQRRPVLEAPLAGR